MRYGLALSALLSIATVAATTTLYFSEHARAAGDRALSVAFMWLNFSKIRSYEELQENQGRYVIVDLRSPEEFRRGHLPGAVNVPGNHMQWLIDTAVKTYDQPVVLYSDDPVRTFAHVFALRLIGYSNAYHLNEGVTADSLG